MRSRRRPRCRNSRLAHSRRRRKAGPSPQAHHTENAIGTLPAAPRRAGVAIATFLALVLLCACSRAPHHAGWVIRSSIELIGPPPAGGYRLAFPYLVGALYGSSNTGAFVRPVSRTPGGFTLDLNRTQAALESELVPTDFSLQFLHIIPAGARIARLTPLALQRDGIDAVGTVQWLDTQSRRPLMLVYVDRPARLEGSFTRASETIRYDIRVSTPGYVWIGSVPAGEHDTLYTAVPPPRRLTLTINTLPSGGDVE